MKPPRKEHTRAELVRMIEAVRRDLREHGRKQERRPELAGALRGVTYYAERLGAAIPRPALMHLQEASHTFVIHAHGAVDVVGRCLTSALEHLATGQEDGGATAPRIGADAPMVHT